MQGRPEGGWGIGRLVHAGECVTAYGCACETKLQEDCNLFYNQTGTIMLWKLMSSREGRNYFDQNSLDVGYNHYNVLKVSVWLVFFIDEDPGNGSKCLK